MKQNKHQQREQEIELAVREIANRVVKEDFALGRYCGDPSIKEEILACLQKKYGISNKQMENDVSLYFLSSYEEEELKQKIIENYAKVVAIEVVYRDFMFAKKNPIQKCELLSVSEVDNYLDKRYGIIWKKIDERLKIYYFASSNEDEIMKKATAQLNRN